MPNTPLDLARTSRIPALEAFVDQWADTTHEFNIATGDAPLEDGTRITDHAAQREERIVLTGYVSSLGQPSRPRAAVETIRRIVARRQPIRLITEWGVYSEMLIRKVNTAYWGRGAQITLECEQVIRVGIIENDLPPGETFGPASGRAGETTRGRVQLEPI